MLTHLHIRNLAVVEDVELEFASGLTVLTGETGAGKSILLDALALAAGERADSRGIRSGAERLEVAATFDLTSQPALRDWLADQDLDEDGECTMRRVVTREGRSRGYVNGRTVSMQSLKALGEMLVDICGQQSHQSLRHRAVQRQLLDSFGENQALAARVAIAHENWQESQTQLAELLSNSQDIQARQELLDFQIAELKTLDLQTGEWDKLNQDLRRTASAEQLGKAVDLALSQLYEGDAVTAHDIISRTRTELAALIEADAELTGPVEMLAEAEILVSEATAALRLQAGQHQHDPARQAEIEQRIGSAHELARKHQIAPDELSELIDKLREEFADLENVDTRTRNAQELTDALARKLQSAAKRLTKARSSAASALSDQVTAQMQQLGMQAGTFKAQLESLTDQETSRNGNETIEFSVAANAGQAGGPIGRVASGGELSRISLSIQAASMAVASVPTLIFDEVDAGVGGGIAEIVGKKLRDLGEQRQVLCVTHLPQVASQGDHHYRVSKCSDAGETRTTVTQLASNERVDEIARMLGGIKITKRTREHAEEMLGVSAARQTT